MTTKKRSNANYPTAVRRGKRLSVSDLEPEYIAKLDRLALTWRCETLGEAMLELLCDAIDVETMKRVDRESRRAG